MVTFHKHRWFKILDYCVKLKTCATFLTATFKTAVFLTCKVQLNSLVLAFTNMKLGRLLQLSYLNVLSMVFHNSKYKNSRRPKISTANRDFAKKSSNESECFSIPSPSSTFAQPSVIKSKSLSGLEVLGSPNVQCLSDKNFESEFLFLKSDVSAPSTILGSNTETSDMSTFSCKPILPIKCSDIIRESKFPIQIENEETNNSSMPKSSLTTCIKTNSGGTEPCTLPSIFDVFYSPPEQHTDSTSDMPGLSESCDAECNVKNAIQSLGVTHVRTEKLVDADETSPKNSRFVPLPPPLPLEEVFAALDRLSSRDQPG